MEIDLALPNVQCEDISEEANVISDRFDITEGPLFISLTVLVLLEE